MLQPSHPSPFNGLQYYFTKSAIYEDPLFCTLLYPATFSFLEPKHSAESALFSNTLNHVHVVLNI
jgi:hypothetical protein